MLYGIISDIHGNIEALTEVLGELDSLGVEKIFCLGDIVGYGASPNECLQKIIERDVLCIMGNHDREAVSEEHPSSFNEDAKRAILWTREELTAEHKDFLRSLSPQRTFEEKTILCHGSPRSVDEYIFSADRASTVLSWLRLQSPATRNVFFGHTHLQMYISTEPNSEVGDLSEPVHLNEAYIHLINPGSVGQPRDGFQAASFLVFDNEAATIEFMNVTYNVKKAASKIEKAGLPVGLAERLRIGV
jgi:predicted phosphodiesterase